MRVWGFAVLVGLVGSGASCQCSKHGGTGSSASASSSSAAASHEGKRPPKPTAVASVSAPKLPKLAGQAPRVSPPKGKPKKDEAPCGTVWTGDEEIPVLCEVPEHGGHPRVGTPAVAIVPYSMLHAPRGDLPITVDHRLDGFEGRTLQQGKAGTCTAFAFASQVNHAVGMWTGKPGDVSVMQIWAHYHVPHDATRPNVGRALVPESEWPYDATRAREWAQCKAGDASCLTEDERSKLQALDRKGTVAIEEIEDLPHDDRLFDVMMAKLAAGRDVGTAGQIAKIFHPVGEPGSKYVPDFSEVHKGGHAFSITGYTFVDDERYFLIKNSWGERWGDGGYAWIHEKSLAKIVHGGYVVVVDPTSAVGLRRHRSHRGLVAACAAGEAPDSVDGACKPLCHDGGPRHDGYCGVTADCTRGHVNLTGNCVLAAPTAHGTEPKSGVSFQCTPSGCVYDIPKGAHGCTAATCQKSCPAPDYRLGQGGGGLLCLE
jgi:hypothetical protein